MVKKVTKGNLVDYIMAHESGELDQEGTLQLFAYLIKTGQAWSLQGSIYGRPARSLIERGIISKKGKINRKKLEELM